MISHVSHAMRERGDVIEISNGIDIVMHMFVLLIILLIVCNLETHFLCNGTHVYTLS